MNNQFPKKFELELTDERRYPNDGDVYCWYDARYDCVHGPFKWIDDSDEIKVKWMGFPHDYAIYTLREVK
jgi:hypothetical protein